VLLLFFFRQLHKATGFIHCTTQGMSATASNQRQRCWGKWPHFLSGELLTAAEIERWIL